MPSELTRISGDLIDGGAINDIPIGDTTPSTGAFTDLSATGNVDFGSTTSVSFPFGSWTPSLVASSGGSPTYGAQIGEYVDYGDLVWVTGRLSITSKGTLSGNLSIGGLPFTNATGTQYLSGGTIGLITSLNLPANTIATLSMVSNSPTIELRTISNTNSGLIGDSEIQNSFQIRFSAWYKKA